MTQPGRHDRGPRGAGNTGDKGLLRQGQTGRARGPCRNPRAARSAAALPPSPPPLTALHPRGPTGPSHAPLRQPRGGRFAARGSLPWTPRMNRYHPPGRIMLACRSDTRPAAAWRAADGRRPPSPRSGLPRADQTTPSPTVISSTGQCHRIRRSGLPAPSSRALSVHRAPSENGPHGTNCPTAYREAARGRLSGNQRRRARPGGPGPHGDRDPRDCPRRGATAPRGAGHGVRTSCRSPARRGLRLSPP